MYVEAKRYKRHSPYNIIHKIRHNTFKIIKYTSKGIKRWEDNMYQREDFWNFTLNNW